MTAPVDPTRFDGARTSEYMRLVDLRFEELSATRVRGSVDLNARHHQPWGLIHGGVYASIVEEAASMGGWAAVAERGQIAVGVNNNTNFLRSMTEGRLDVVAVPLQQTRTQQLWQVTLTGADGKVVAVGELRMQNVTPRA